MEVRAAHGPEQWDVATQLLFAYQRETAVQLGQEAPGCPEEVWGPVRGEVADPASVFSTYLIAYEGADPLGGVAVVGHDAFSVMLKRCYVRPHRRRRGVARALATAADNEAAQRGVERMVLSILASRRCAITAWSRMGFLEVEPRGDTSMRYFERRVRCKEASPWLGLYRDAVAVRDHDPRWASVYRHHAEVLRGAVADQVITVEHVGSTAVEGLPAKPVVDVAARLAPPADERNVIVSLEDRGYTFRGDKGQGGGLMFVAEDRLGRRVAHLHVLHHDDSQWDRYLQVRNLLRADEGARIAYADLKSELTGRFPGDRGAYTAAKGSYLESLLG